MDDLDMLELLEQLQSLERRPKIIHSSDRQSDLEILDEIDFCRRYRFNKNIVNYLVELLTPKLMANSTRNNYLSPSEKICIALRFYACGAFQQIVGDLNAVSQSSTCRAITQVSECIAELRQQYIRLPNTEEERREISQKFYQRSGFPGVYGALDCTHIPIRSPGGELAETFRCRKGYFSLNIQTVSDADLYIRDVVACWPGSTHDMTIFNNCHIRAEMEAGNIPPYYHLLGDSGYACRSYLLTPFLNPVSSGQRRYNFCHIQARNAVERQYGVWKRRFSCLASPLRCTTKNTMTIIVATAVLHNIALSKNDIIQEYNTREDTNSRIVTDGTTAGFAKRNAIHFEL